MSAQVNYNTEAICENVDTLALCEILGIPVKKKGATYFSECPNPEHHEEKIYPGNGGCHCFACGKTYRPYGMAKDWLEKQGQIVSGSEIYGILGDAAGGREQYIIKGRFKPEEKFPLSKKLMDILDFKTNTGFNEIKSCETDKDGMILSTKQLSGTSLGPDADRCLKNTENLPMCSQSREPHPDRQSPECTRAMHWR